MGYYALLLQDDVCLLLKVPAMVYGTLWRIGEEGGRGVSIETTARIEVREKQR